MKRFTIILALAAASMAVIVPTASAAKHTLTLEQFNPLASPLAVGQHIEAYVNNISLTAGTNKTECGHGHEFSELIVQANNAALDKFEGAEDEVSSGCSSTIVLKKGEASPQYSVEFVVSCHCNSPVTILSMSATESTKTHTYPATLGAKAVAPLPAAPVEVILYENLNRCEYAVATVKGVHSPHGGEAIESFAASNVKLALKKSQPSYCPKSVTTTFVLIPYNPTGGPNHYVYGEIH